MAWLEESGDARVSASRGVDTMERARANGGRTTDRQL